MADRPSACRGRRIKPEPPDYWRYDCDWIRCPINYPDEACWFRLDDDDPNPLDYQPPDDHAADASVSEGVATPDPDLRCHSIRWACVYTQPQAETWAASNLTTAGYRVWFPTSVVQRRDRATPTIRHAVTVPLFPRYGFIAFDHRDTSWSPIRNTPGVVDLVRCGSLPAYTSDTHMVALRTVLDASQAAAASIDAPDATRRVGALVAPGNGSPFAGHQAVVTAVRGNRALIAMLLFGELRQVSVDVTSLVSRE